MRLGVRSGYPAGMMAPLKYPLHSARPPIIALVFAGTVAAAYLSSLHGNQLHLDRPDGRWCVLWGVLYGAIGAIAIGRTAGRKKQAPYVFLLALEYFLLCAILWTSRLGGEITICVYPLLGMAVAMLPPVAGAAAALLLYVSIIAIESHFYGAAPAVNWMVGLIPAFGFVIVFSRLAVVANEARERALAMAADVEALAVVRERNRLAHEIHDSLGHFLTTIHVQLQAARAIHAAHPDRAMESVAKAQGLARDALEEVRRSVSALKVDADPAPLPERVRELAEVTDGCGTRVTFDLRGEIRRLRPETEHALFRAAQEGLTNVRKHAGAQSAAVILDYSDPSRVRLEVVDDGRGAAETPGTGNGLPGVVERISALGGRVEAGNAQPAGFRLFAELPA